LGYLRGGIKEGCDDPNWVTSEAELKRGVAGLPTLNLQNPPHLIGNPDDFKGE